VSKPFDATTRDLLETHPESWMEYLHLGWEGSVRVINADLSTITAEADKVLRVDDSEPWLVHIELQAGHDSWLARRLLRYNVLLNYRHALPVFSVVVLLRPEADASDLSGRLEQCLPQGRDYLTFRYHVLRAWEQPAEAVLEGGLGTLPMAPLADVAPDALPIVLRRIGERFRHEATPSEAATLWAATTILMGLRFPREVVAQLLQGARDMIFGIRGIEESSVYQAILAQGKAAGLAEGLAEGKAEEAKHILLRQGQKRFGSPPPQVTTAILALTDLERIEQLAERLLDVSSWDDLLAPA
jgi:predicted transposase YdaD